MTNAEVQGATGDQNAMIHIPGGMFRMGSDSHYAEEKPTHRVPVDDFLIEATPVTNAVSRSFVETTGHVTFAEIPPDPKDYPGALPHMLKAGSLVFTPPDQPVDTRDWSQWWTFRFRANWRRPYGPGSSIKGLDWQGLFPAENLKTDGYERTSPVRAFPPNGYGLYDMIGNVWEWTADVWSTRHPADAPKACCVPENPRGGPMEASYDPRQPQIRIPRKVLKGGSHLCAPNYCRRYRPAARHAEPIDTSTSHVGFRCVRRS